MIWEKMKYNIVGIPLQCNRIGGVSAVPGYWFLGWHNGLKDLVLPWLWHVLQLRSNMTPGLGTPCATGQQKRKKRKKDNTVVILPYYKGFLRQILVITIPDS